MRTCLANVLACPKSPFALPTRSLAPTIAAAVHYALVRILWCCHACLTLSSCPLDPLHVLRGNVFAKLFPLHSQTPFSIASMLLKVPSPYHALCLSHVAYHSPCSFFIIRAACQESKSISLKCRPMNSTIMFLCYCSLLHHSSLGVVLMSIAIRVRCIVVSCGAILQLGISFGISHPVTICHSGPSKDACGSRYGLEFVCQFRASVRGVSFITFCNASSIFMACRISFIDAVLLHWSMVIIECMALYACQGAASGGLLAAPLTVP